MKNKWLGRVVALGVLLLLVVVLLAVGSVGLGIGYQGWTLASAIIDPDVDELAAAVRAELLINYFQMRLEDARFEDNWAYSTVSVYDPNDSQSVHNRSFKILARQVSDKWLIAFAGDPILHDWMQDVPSGLLLSDERDSLVSNAAVTPAASVGHYELPYPAGLRYRVTSDWDDCRGWDDQGNCIAYHHAIDFGMPEWDEVVAAMKGEVIDFRSDSTRCCGDSSCGGDANFVKLYHSDVGEYTYYVHFAPNSVPSYIQVGATIEQGMKIGEAGHSGWTWPACAGNHVHFAVTNGSGVLRNPYFVEKPGTVWYWDYIYSQNTPPTSAQPPNNQPPNPPALNIPTNGSWLSSRTVTLEWLDGGDPDDQPNDFRDYNIVVWDDSGWRAEQGWPVGVFYTDTSWGLTVPRDGTYYWHVRAGDGELPSEWSETWSFHVDASPPHAPALSIGGPGCSGVPNNGWQNTCNDPAFTWNAVDAGGSGIQGYYYCWSTSPNCSPATWTTATGFDPGPIAPVDGTATYYLDVRARDNMNYDSSLTSFGVRYDGTQPTVSLQTNGGAATTNQISMLLNLAAGDTGSGVAGVRISNNNLAWSGWQPYADVIRWTLPSVDHRAHTVYVQVRDRAGNVSVAASDAIFLDSYPPMPHSAHYRLCADVVDAGGSVSVTSSSYSLVSSIGQPWATGANDSASAGFAGRTGFLSSLTGCLPISYTVTSDYTVINWVIASGGSLRSSTSYRLGDTTGQSLASGATVSSSPNYRLSSGFWAHGTSAVPPVSPDPTPVPVTPTPTPTPGPTPTPQPGGFGLSINDGALYTNDSLVTVRVWAPHVTHMRLSNDGGYSEENWQTYQITTTWIISTYGDCVLSRYVYAWFRDAQGDVYGPYFDDIIYDPVAPEGQVNILGSETSDVMLWLEAWDDNSGVAGMRVSESPTLEGASWQTYNNLMEWTLTGNVVYAQFRDNAGNLSPVYGSDGSHNLTEKVYLPMVLRNHP